MKITPCSSIGWQDVQKILYADSLENLAREYEGITFFSFADHWAHGTNAEATAKDLREVRAAMEAALDLAIEASKAAPRVALEESPGGEGKSVCLRIRHFTSAIENKKEEGEISKLRNEIESSKGARSAASFAKKAQAALEERRFFVAGEPLTYRDWLGENSQALNATGELDSVRRWSWRLCDNRTEWAKDDRPADELESVLGALVMQEGARREISEATKSLLDLAISLHTTKAAIFRANGRMRAYPLDALTALWLSIAEGIESGRVFRCKVCGRICLARASTRAYEKTTCGSACRTWASRNPGKKRPPKPYKTKPAKDTDNAPSQGA